MIYFKENRDYQLSNARYINLPCAVYVMTSVICRACLRLFYRLPFIVTYINKISIYMARKAREANKTNKKDYLKDVENITRWREDMNFMFEWQELYLTSELRSLVRYCFCHENIKFMSSS